MISKIKIFIQFLILYFISFFIPKSKKIIPKTILLFRLDGIGDYILFRNFINVLLLSDKYKDYKITLICNQAYKELTKELDKNYIHNFIWLDTDNFFKKPVYIYKKLKEITKQGYEVVINPTYSRKFLVMDSIIRIVSANDKIGSIGNLSNMQNWQKKLGDKYYTQLIPAKDDILFEFDRNKEFFGKLLNQKISITKPSIDLKTKQLKIKLPKKYAILFIGASTDSRKWNIKYFVQVANYLVNIYGYEIVLCGAPSDEHIATKFKKYFDQDYIDLVGKTSLVDLLYVVENAKIMLSNETSIPHFAISLEKPEVFVIYKGVHYGRFTPYPKAMTNKYHVIYHPKIEEDLEDYKKISNSYKYNNDFNIDDISVGKVIKKLDKILNS